MSEIELSIVIVSWNTRELTQGCVASLMKCRSTKDTEIIVVDNASDDDTVDFLQREYPEVILFANEDNRLYSEANNQGAEAATGRYLCILNSDTVVPAGSMEDLIQFLETHEDYAIVGPKLLNEDGSAQDSCNRFFSPLEEFLMTSGLGKFPPGSAFLRKAHLEDFDYQASGDVQQIMGACLMFRRSEYLDRGGFDPALSLYYNDHDLCWQFLKQGKKSRYLAETAVLHLRGQSTKSFNDLNLHWNSNRVAFLQKHYGWRGRFLARSCQRYKAAKVFLKIVLGPRSMAKKREAIRELKDKMRKILAT